MPDSPPDSPPDPERDRALTRSLTAWFARSKRDFPWRTDPHTPRDPWASLVSEIMLQQTQASRVAERFGAILTRFPTPAALAESLLDDLLALWAGLGYYRRARLLHACAQAIVERHAGEVPRELDALRALPGVGAYTAGAVASIACNVRTPIVDGNVTRVLMRLANTPGTAKDRPNVKLAWARAAELVDACEDPAAFNEGLMELGALVCTPRNPRCDACPLNDFCRAHTLGTQEEVPAPSPGAKRKTLHCASLVVTDTGGRVLVRQRPDTGLWAGLWEAPTLEHDSAEPDADAVRTLADLATPPEHIGSFVHQTTHREVRFAVWRGQAAGGAPGRWIEPAELGTLGIASAQRRVFALALGESV